MTGLFAAALWTPPAPQRLQRRGLLTPLPEADALHDARVAWENLCCAIGKAEARKKWQAITKGRAAPKQKRKPGRPTGSANPARDAELCALHDIARAAGLDDAAARELVINHPAAKGDLHIGHDAPRKRLDRALKARDKRRRRWRGTLLTPEPPD